ncbi:MAG: redoxin domain-containing protein [Gemmataceae bacterium]|nr:redoxin domain-containing protein [Gemmataceae bacterium]
MRSAICALLLASGIAAAALPKEGEPAPAFDLPAANAGAVLKEKKDAKKLSLKDLEGKNVVLWFYPRALTGG